MSGSIPMLPFELYAEILEWLYNVENAEVDYRTLSICSLVCTAWRPISQRRLFRRLPWLFSGEQASQFIEIFHDNPGLGAHVRGMSLFIVPALAQSNRTSITFYQFVTLLSCCRQVQALRIMYDAPQGELTAQNLEQVRALGLQLVMLECEVMTRTVYQLCSQWPTIRYMLCGAVRNHGVPGDFPLPGERAPFALRGLVLKRSVRTSIMSWLFPTDADVELQEVDMFALRESDPLLVHARGIRALRLKTPPTPAVVSSLTGLEEYIFRYAVRTPLALPPTVRHVGFHAPGVQTSAGEREKELDCMLDIISKTPLLRLVTVHSGMDDLMMASLEDRCRERGVTLVGAAKPRLLVRAHNIDCF
ncbi:hypothetical protein BV25DRAFT_1916592 [Artomyces pyxidatus]|uniref:Uncharacterized protein n=1 Tax=Artomyces pyxidatus TaxID=48021 RepID=A0ACB8T1F4_9AGAM|nr:hypothetical protein BV25DRAFT_1916592 [Artomyces pyxidatus]